MVTATVGVTFKVPGEVPQTVYYFASGPCSPCPRSLRMLAERCLPDLRRLYGKRLKVTGVRLESVNGKTVN